METSPTSTAKPFLFDVATPAGTRDCSQTANAHDDFIMKQKEHNLKPSCMDEHVVLSNSQIDVGTNSEVQESQTDSEGFDFKSLRAMLEQKSVKDNAITTLDDHYKKQRNKKVQDLQKKNEAENYLRSYHQSVAGSPNGSGERTSAKNGTMSDINVAEEASTSLNKNVVSLPNHNKIEKVVKDETTVNSEEEFHESTFSNNENPAATSVMSDGYNTNESHFDKSKDAAEEIFEMMPMVEFCKQKYSDVKEIKETDNKIKMDDDNIPKTYDGNEININAIPKFKHVLVPPERDYLKLLSSCWCVHSSKAGVSK